MGGTWWVVVEEAVEGVAERAEGKATERGAEGVAAVALMGFAPFALTEGCFPTPCQSPVSAKGEGAERKARGEA